MGHILRHTVIVTSWSGDELAKAHTKAQELGVLTTPIIASTVNGYAHFVVLPDGSKEGWALSAAGDERRAALLEHLRSAAYEDGSSCLEWFEVSYGSDDGVAALCAVRA